MAEGRRIKERALCRPAFGGAVRLSLLYVCIAAVLALQPARAQTVPYTSADAQLAERLFRAVDLKFETGQATIHPSMLPVLDAVTDILERFPQLRLEVAGHTDARGSDGTNLRLSDERALAAKAYLVARYGVSPDRLVPVGYGEAMPIASNATQTGRALNRRVEFRVIQEDAPSAAAEERPVDVDSLREAIREQVAEAAASAMGEPDTTAVSEAERELQARLAELERRLAEATDDDDAAVETPVFASPAARRTALLPFTGLYLRSDLPIVLGIRADFPTTLLGAPRFQPELAFGFRPDDRATLFGANLVWPITLGFRPDVTPFIGAGIGFHDLDGFESVLNVLIGTEYRTTFGILFAEYMMQDFFDFNRVAVGFRQEF